MLVLVSHRWCLINRPGSDENQTISHKSFSQSLKLLKKPNDRQQGKKKKTKQNQFSVSSYY